MAIPRILRSVAALAATAAVLSAQCQFTSVSLQNYGSGCSEVFGFYPTLRFELDQTNCTLAVTVDADSGCCNTFLQATAIVLSVRQAGVPLPLADPLCTLLVQPDTILIQSGPVATPFVLPLPPTMPPASFLAQGVAGYYTTVTFPRPFALQFALTAGYVASLR
ncbi:MAG: hypothetical protein AB7O97_19860 [Planctomycetota bacterium]